MDTSRLRIALQKSGRLSEDSLDLFRQCDLSFESNRGSAVLRSEVRNFPAEFLFLRDDDIPKYVADGAADVGILGENVVVESNAPVEIVLKLGFSRCRLSLAVPKGSAINTPRDLGGCRIATSYPRILQGYLEREGINAKIHEISGSVEIAPSMGLGDAICDIVGTGSTLLLNGLRELHPIFFSEAVLIAGPKLSPTRSNLLRKLQFRIEAVSRGAKNRYILLNAPNESLPQVIKILPGLKSPTIIPLAEKGWSSVHSVVKDEEFWDVLEELQAVGAEGILVGAIKKMVG